MHLTDPTADTRVVKEMETGSSLKFWEGGQQATGAHGDKRVSARIQKEIFPHEDSEVVELVTLNEVLSLSLEDLKSQLDQAVNSPVSPHSRPCFGVA